MMRIFQQKKSNPQKSKANASSNGESSAAITVGALRIGNLDYAVNLHWELTEDSSLAVREARSRASAPNISAEYYCVRSASTKQFGLGFKQMGHRSMMPSLASLLAYNISGNWLGLFELETGYYVLGVQNEGIFAETDRYFESKEGAGCYFQEIQNLMDWDTLYAPSEFQFDGAETMNLQDFLAAKSSVKLKRINKWDKIVKIALIGCISCLAFFAANHAFDNPVKKVIDSLRESRRNVETSVQQVQNGKSDIPPMPWEGKLQGTDVLAECVESIGSFAATVPGWIVSELICDGYNASSRLKRDGIVGQGGGSATWILPYVRRPGFEPTVVFPHTGTDNLVEVNWNLRSLPKISADIRTVPISIVRAALLHAFENRMTRITLNETDSAAYWRGLSFKFSTTVNPLGFDDILAAIPGVMIQSVHYGMEAGLWTIEGKAYEKLIPQISQAN